MQVYILTIRYIDPLGRYCRTRIVGTSSELNDMVVGYWQGGCRKLRVIGKRACEQR